MRLLALVGILCWDLAVHSVLRADGTRGGRWDANWGLGGRGLGMLGGLDTAGAEKESQGHLRDGGWGGKPTEGFATEDRDPRVGLRGL